MTLRAGHYLNDKEFCYLRTVKVTADVEPKWNGSRISPNVVNLKLSTVIVLNSCSVNENKKPKRSVYKAKIIQIKYYKYLITTNQPDIDIQRKAKVNDLYS